MRISDTKPPPVITTDFSQGENEMKAMRSISPSMREATMAQSVVDAFKNFKKDAGDKDAGVDKYEKSVKRKKNKKKKKKKPEHKIFKAMLIQGAREEDGHGLDEYLWGERRPQKEESGPERNDDEDTKSVYSTGSLSISEAGLGTQKWNDMLYYRRKYRLLTAVRRLGGHQEESDEIAVEHERRDESVNGGDTLVPLKKAATHSSNSLDSHNNKEIQSSLPQPPQHTVINSKELKARNKSRISFRAEENKELMKLSREVSSTNDESRKNRLSQNNFDLEKSLEAMDNLPTLDVQNQKYLNIHRNDAPRGIKERIARRQNVRVNTSTGDDDQNFDNAQDDASVDEFNYELSSAGENHEDWMSDLTASEFEAPNISVKYESSSVLDLERTSTDLVDGQASSVSLDAPKPSRQHKGRISSVDIVADLFAISEEMRLERESISNRGSNEEVRSLCYVSKFSQYSYLG